MSNERKGPESYVRRVSEVTRRYAEDLLRENEILRARVVALQSEVERVQAELIQIENELVQRREESDRLRQTLASVEIKNHEYAERYAEVEQQTANLTNLCVASYRLQGTLNPAEVLTAIEEIVVNLIGSEELAVFEMSADKSTLILLSSSGIDVGKYSCVAVGDGVIGEAARTGQLYLRRGNDSDDDSPVTACIPLMLDGMVTGAIAIFGLLPQKPGIESLDRELFDLLALHSAGALYCARMHTRWVASGSSA